MCINANWCLTRACFGPLLFLFYINDFNLAIKHCKAHHFADDKNLLYTNNSIKKLNKLLNKGLKKCNLLA